METELSENDVQNCNNITYTNIYYISVESNVSLQAPYNWRHAALKDVKEFLEAEVKAKRFHPKFKGGLDLWMYMVCFVSF